MPTLGYEGSLLRAIGHWVNDENIEEWLKKGVPVLVEKDTHLFSYVLASDTGFAPNVSDGYCTLACCKPKIRSAARVGDWVMGTLPKSIDQNRLGYIMRINEILSFDDYFNDERFKNKHHSEEDLSHDTQTDKVLVSSLFWYFGDKAPRIPKFMQVLIKTGPSHKRIRNAETETVRDFVSWVSLNYRPGVLGNSRDGDDSGRGRGVPSYRVDNR